MKPKKIKATISLLIYSLFIFFNFQGTKCKALDYKSLDFVINNQITIGFPQVYEWARELTEEYSRIISAKYEPGSEYNQRLIEWRKEVMRYYYHLKRQMNDSQMAAYFITMLSFIKLKRSPTMGQIEKLYRLSDIKTYLITPTNKRHALLPEISDDPNGSIQSILYYHGETIPDIICI